MPVFKNRTVFEIARGVRAFLNLEAGVVRGEALDGPGSGVVRAPGDGELGRIKQRLAEAERENARLSTKLAAADNGGIKPENLVWIFGSARTGSTWFSAMMRDLEGHSVWDEPLVGDLFGHLYYVRGANHIDKRGNDFILGNPHRESWLNSVRSFVRNEATARFPEAARGGYLVVKEPNGSLGAPLLMEALPESRMIFLIRDPRDMVASLLDAHREGSWLYEWRQDVARTEEALTNKDPIGFAKSRARNYLRNAEGAKQAYDAHKGLKVLVKYEDLRSDTLDTMKRVYSTLEVPVDEGELAQVVDKHSWENIPKEEKGEGKFNRKATPGAWREDLTTEQVKVVERITAPLLKEFYPG